MTDQIQTDSQPKQKNIFPPWVKNIKDARICGALEFCGVRGKDLQRFDKGAIERDNWDGAPAKKYEKVCYTILRIGIVLGLAILPFGSVFGYFTIPLGLFVGIALPNRMARAYLEHKEKKRIGITPAGLIKLREVLNGELSNKKQQIKADRLMRQAETAWQNDPRSKVSDIDEWTKERMINLIAFTSGFEILPSVDLTRELMTDKASQKAASPSAVHSATNNMTVEFRLPLPRQAHQATTQKPNKNLLRTRRKRNRAVRKENAAHMRNNPSP